MNHFESQIDNHTQSITEAEATLRLVAQQPVPEGLAGRVHRRLAQERIALAVQEPERRGFWRLWLPAHRVQFAGAAAVAAVVAVSMLSVRHPSPNGKTPQAVVPVPAQSGSFGTSAAQAHPTTLKPIQVPEQSKNAQSKKKKPSAGHSAKRAEQAPAASQTDTNPEKH